MIEIITQAIPNQTLSVVLSNQQYDITLKETNGVMSASISRNEIPIVSNCRMVNSEPLLPYLYQEEGNFIFDNNSEDLPDYRQFGITQRLLYFTAAELEIIRGGT